MMCSASVAGISSSRARPSRRPRWLLATTTRRPPGRSRPGADSNLTIRILAASSGLAADDGRTLEVLQIADRIKADVTTAMKAGERERVTALRLVLSELQKAEKDGGDVDEVAVLRRERKRRREAETAYREAGRTELAEGEAFEAGIIDTYLPAELSDEELEALVRAGVETTGAASPRDMGRVIKHVMEAAGGRADGKRVSTKVKEALS